MRLRPSTLTASAVPLLVLLVLVTIVAARSPATVHDARPAIEPHCAKPALVRSTGSRDNEFEGWWHDAGELLLHTSNYGFFGNWGIAEGEPSAEWPAGSGSEHLFCAGLWVGARVGSDTLVTTAVYGIEFRAPPDDPVYTIYESASGAPHGEPGFDDDSDGSVDEDRLDGIDNDLDGATDEDYAAISDEMFACAYFDTAEIDHAPPEDLHVPIDLEVYETSYAWSAPLFDDFVRIRYEITNIGQVVLEEVYLGLMADPDVGSGLDPIYVDDRVAYLDKEVPEAPTQQRVRLQMAHCWDEPGGPDGDWDGHIGFMVLDHPTDPDGITAPPSVGPLVYRSWYAGSQDPEDDGERYRYMSEPLISPPAATPQDWRFLLSVGPFSELAPDETVFLEVAVVCGEGLRGLAENAAAVFCRLEDASVLDRLEEQTQVSGDREREPESPRFCLARPSPNPATAGTRIAFLLAEREHVELSLWNCAGRRVATLIDGELTPGEHSESWNGRTDSGAPASSGVYVVRLRAGGEEGFEKLVLVR